MIAPFVLAAVLGGQAPGAEHFQEAWRRYNRGDAEGALAEFQRARQLDPRPAVLFNIGLIAFDLGRAAEALEALDQLLAAPGALPPEKVARAREVRGRAAARLGTLVVTTVEGAKVQVGGKSVGVAPLGGPVSVPVGRVLVSATAPAYAPRHTEVTVRAGERAEVALPLEPLSQIPAQVEVRCALPGTDVLIDSVRVAVTPVDATLPVVPGTHRVQLVREGYRTAEREVRLGEGALGVVAAELEEDPAATARDGAVVRPSYSESQVQLSVDGVRRTVDAASISLPPGPHVLLFERGGFYPVRRSLTLEKGSTTGLEVVFEPLPELRAELEERRSRRRLWGLVGLAAGAGLLAGGGGTLFFNLTEADKARERARLAQGQLLSAACATPAARPACEGELAASRATVERLEGLVWLGPLLMAVGLAAAAGGAVSYFTAPDLSRFDRAPAHGELEPAFGLAAGPHGVTLAVGGRF